MFVLPFSGAYKSLTLIRKFAYPTYSIVFTPAWENSFISAKVLAFRHQAESPQYICAHPHGKHSKYEEQSTDFQRQLSKVL